MSYEINATRNQFPTRTVTAEAIDLGIRNGRRLRAEVMRDAIGKLRHGLLRGA